MMDVDQQVETPLCTLDAVSGDFSVDGDVIAWTVALLTADQTQEFDFCVTDKSGGCATVDGKHDRTKGGETRSYSGTPPAALLSRLAANPQVSGQEGVALHQTVVQLTCNENGDPDILLLARCHA
jgi:hypothetical protein